MTPSTTSSDTTPDQPGRDIASQTAPTFGTPPLSPGDEAAPGTPGTAENTCPMCGGSGEQDGQRCTDCAGTGRVTVGIGGA